MLTYLFQSKEHVITPVLLNVNNKKEAYHLQFSSDFGDSTYQI